MLGLCTAIKDEDLARSTARFASWTHFRELSSQSFSEYALFACMKTALLDS